MRCVSHASVVHGLSHPSLAVSLALVPARGKHAVAAVRTNGSECTQSDTHATCWVLPAVWSVGTATEAFPFVGDRIKYEGPESRNVLAFKHYNPDEVILGKVALCTSIPMSGTAHWAG